MKKEKIMKKEKCRSCKKFFKIKYLNKNTHRKNFFTCKRYSYFNTKYKKYGFKKRKEFEKWYMKQWNFQLGHDPLGIPLPNQNPYPEWEGAASVDHNHITGKIRGLCSKYFNNSIKIFEYKS
ncbi:hypothetical protein LCGC14_1151980, partial [marine sediment metagenome]